ncbi:MAG: Crp/Fnr family transcriptional regulator [Sulfitobacter sp.]|nr:Crp/Fnr family transcriptional regulator [Sulfitobacter sp.]
MLPNTGFLKAASPELLEVFNTLAKKVTVAENETLFSEFDEGDALYVVLDGSIEITKESEDGRRLGLELMRSGAVFGEIALFDPGQRTATAVAMEPTELIQIRNKDLMRELNARPELALDLLRLAGSRMRLMNSQLHEYVFLALPARLARKILHLTAGTTDPDAAFKLSQTDLADFTGATREAVSKTLSIWKQDAFVETGRGTLKVLDRPALLEIAGLDAL